MAEKQVKTINLAAQLATVISSRDIVDRLTKQIKSAHSKRVDLDFFKVEFLSRSAAHELLILKEDLERTFISKKFITFINANNEINNMLRIVAANRASPKAKPLFSAQKTDIFELQREVG